MISHVREAERATGRRMKVLMDLAGPKIRTGAGRALHGAKRAVVGDRLAVVAPGGLAAEFDADVAFAVECTLPEALAAAAPGHHLFIDDGKIQCVVERTATAPPMIVARINRCKEGGAKLKPEKGLNFPDSDLRVPALTAKDAEDLLFAAANADGISYSFVQEPDDVALLQDALAALDPAKARRLPVILKIETARAVRNLPDILVRAAGRQPAALMIARGDLAIELGFARTAEMQEEILWLGEAAGVPVIWATQVLENLVKGGLRSRGEETDAAMGARAECIMLNKGPFILDAISDLDVLLARMEEHVHKKTPQLRKLVSWQGSSGTIAAGIDGEAANGTQA
ncbi:putative pyruvate kinase [Hyaloraphidium curvatum]|nr:putative pyruvate kinase [Hyaloraphidium curvatum]